MILPHIVNNEMLVAGATYRQGWEFFETEYNVAIANNEYVYADDAAGPGTRGTPLAEVHETPVDWTGCTARAQIRDEVGAESSLLDLTTENARLYFTGPTVWVAIAPVDTSAVARAAVSRTAVMQIEVKYANGDIDRILEINFVISPESTLIPDPEPTP